MKAVVMEIHKDYCIVMTEDGQFLRQEIPAGRLEIGDEIVIEKEYYYERRASWVKSFAIAASVVVVVAIGSVFGVRYLKQYYPAGDIAMVAEEKAVAEEATREEVLMEEEALPTEEGTEEPALAIEAEQEETIIYKSEDIYSLKEEGMIEKYIEEIMIKFSYKVIDSTSLLVSLENSSTYSFSGNFNLVMLLSDGSVARTKTIFLEGFKPGDIYKKQFPLEAGEAEFRLEVTESIN